MMLLAMLPLVDPMIVKVLIDDVLVDGNMSLLKLLIIGLIALFALNGVLYVLTSYIYTYVGQKILFDIRYDFFRHLEKLHLGFFSKTKTGEIMSRVNNDVGKLQQVMTTTFVTMVTDIITLVGILALIIYLDWKLTLVSVVLLPFIFVTQFFLGKKIKKRSTESREKSADILSFFQETISGMRLIQSFVKERFEAARFVRKGRSLIDIQVRLGVMSAIAGAAAGFLAYLGPIIVLGYGGYKVIHGSLTIGSMVAFYAYVGRLFGPIYRLAQHNVSIQTARASIDRIFEYLDIEPEIRDTRGSIVLRKMEGSIAFDGVRFAYDHEQPVFENLSFDIPPGRRVAIVGRSGAGKSTIVNLLCRFYDPQSGKILVDNHDVRNIQLRSLRRNIGLVSQETILFNSSVRENLLYGKTSATEEEIKEASRRAYIHELISSLPQRYETVIGERGIRLSGGERQRLSIARTILKNPKILVFDEATSSLDSRSERLIQDAIEPLMEGRTSIIIAHRLSTVVNADWILVLDNGRLVETGTHNELLTRGGIYRMLWNEMSVKGDASLN